MNTFDVFDTLIARRTITGDSIIKKLEKKFNISNFAYHRQKADNGNRSLFEIYKSLADSNIIKFDKIEEYCRLEIQEEIDNCFPISKNIKKVEHGDVLISDMYLPNWAIVSILKSCGLDKEIGIYQSNGDKRSGEIWGLIADYHNGIHLGDNVESDIKQAQNKKIKTELTTVWQQTQLEKILYQNNLESLSFLCREVRLRSTGNLITDIASDVNLVILILLSELLFRRYSDLNLIFLGRDCQLLEQIYSTFYKPSSYLPFSRQVAYTQPEVSIKYLNQYKIKDCRFVDISSTGATWEKLQNNIPITVAIYSDTYFYTQNRPVPPKDFEYIFTNSKIGTTNHILELFNCGNHGHLSKIDLVGDKFFKPNFDHHELDISLIENIQTPIKIASKLSSVYKTDLENELKSLSTVEVESLLENFIKYLCSHDDIIDKTFLDKETAYLNKIQNYDKK